MKKVSPSHALGLYGLIVGFVFVAFVLGLLIGTSGAERTPIQEPVQNFPPVEELDTQADFYEQLSKPSEELQREEPEVVVQQGEIVDPTESAPAEDEEEDTPERVIVQGSERYTIQVAAHSNLADAQQLLIRLSARGFEGKVSEPEPGSEDQYFRVWVGDFSSSADAESVAAQLREENFHTYIRRIN